jgi:hypothetical protein
MTAPELKPCPFCGGPAELIRPHDGGLPYVMCVMHFCSGPQKTAEHAIAAWNRRADLPPTMEQAKALPEIKALVEALRVSDEFVNSLGYVGIGNITSAALRAIGEGGE